MAWHVPVNFAETTVTSGALNNTTSPLTFSVATGAVFGSSFPLYAVVDPAGVAEVIEITARSTNSITATRPNAVAHAGAPKIICAMAAEYLTEVQTAVDLKAPLASPALTGTPTAPTAAANTNTTQIATTAFVQAASAEYPWLVEINPMYASFTDTNFHDIYLSNDASAPQVMGAASGTGARFPLNAGLFNSGAQNDEVSFNVVLGAGTWSFRSLHSTFGNAGICTVSLGGSSLGTIDMYSATNYAGVKAEFTSVSVATSGKKVLNLKMTSKNGSSTGYYAILHYLWLVRTA